MSAAVLRESPLRCGWKYGFGPEAPCGKSAVVAVEFTNPCGCSGVLFSCEQGRCGNHRPAGCSRCRVYGTVPTLRRPINEGDLPDDPTERVHTRLVQDASKAKR